MAGKSGGDFALARYDDGLQLGYVENARSQIINNGITLTDIDSDNMESAIIQITAAYHSDQDTLSIGTQYLPVGVTATWDGVTGKLTINGLASTANYESIFEHVTYTNSRESPNTSPRMVTWTVNDDAVDSVGQTSTITVTAVNDLPTASGPVAATTLNEDGSVSITVYGTDVDNPDLSDVSFAITSDVSNGILIEGDTSLVSAGHYSKVYTYTPDANFNGSDRFAF